MKKTYTVAAFPCLAAIAGGVWKQRNAKHSRYPLCYITK